MDIPKIILNLLARKKEVRVAEIVKKTGFSRVYINHFFKELRDGGRIILIGKANRAHYVSAENKDITKARRSILSFHQILDNQNLSEDLVLDEIKHSTGIFFNLAKNIAQILDYAFTEMLNNAIEHSRSKTIEVITKRNENDVYFEVTDKGIGIFNNLMKKRDLKTELEAIQDLLKGKQTTAPKEHTGEGIFFTSKAADTLNIQSSKKKLIFNNNLEDIFIKERRYLKGTKVTFVIDLKSKRDLNLIFKEYAGESFEFSKTKVIVNLYKMDTAYVSRSQARRILTGLEKFKTVVLDFKKVDSAGQAFADEIFRIWKFHHPKIDIQYQNANENIVFMIKRALVKIHEV